FMLRDPHVPGPSVFWEVLAVRMVLAAAKAPRLRLPTPLCERHRNYWRFRSALVYGGLAGMLAVLLGGLVAGLVAVILLITVARVDKPWLSCCVVVPFLLYLLAWVIPVRAVMSGTIRARLTEDDRVVLQNVGEGYAAAVEAARRRQRPG